MLTNNSTNRILNNCFAENLFISKTLATVFADYIYRNPTRYVCSSGSWTVPVEVLESGFYRVTLENQFWNSGDLIKKSNYK